MMSAYQKGISPYHFRKTRSDDLNFIIDFKEMLVEKEELERREHQIKETMEKLSYGRSR